LTAFSQSVTRDTIPTKCFSIPVVKAIAKDLLKGDSAIAMLKLTEDQLKETEKKSALKDSVITAMSIKESNYLRIIEDDRKKYRIVVEDNKDLQKRLKVEKVKNKFTKIISGGAILVLGILLIK
jgi:hypothetical protein